MFIILNLAKDFWGPKYKWKIYFLNGGLSWKEAEPRVQKSIFWIVTVVVNGVGTVVQNESFYKNVSRKQSWPCYPRLLRLRLSELLEAVVAGLLVKACGPHHFCYYCLRLLQQIPALSRLLCQIFHQNLILSLLPKHWSLTWHVFWLGIELLELICHN